jgi:pilus assembly protein CpaF
MTTGHFEDLRRAVLRGGAALNVQGVREAAMSRGLVLDERGIARAAQALSADLRGFGPLESLLRDATVTDIAVNGSDEVWIDRGEGMTLSTARFVDDASVRRMAQRLAVSSGRRLDDASPYVDAPLADGIRLHAMLPPLCDRISVALRIPRHRSWSLDDLAANGMVPPAARNLLGALIDRRCAFVITGGTGTGKTTLLNALLGEVRPSERLVLVEDTRELAPSHPHVVRLQTRAPNIEGAGGVTMQDLVRQTLRMRPDRIVVGEVRGPEVVDLLTALNTGHRGGCGTVHANSAADVVPRLEALGALAGLSRDGVQRLVLAALEVVIHLDRDDSGSRRLKTLAMVESLAGEIHIAPAYSFAATGEVTEGPGVSGWRLAVHDR